MFELAFAAGASPDTIRAAMAADQGDRSQAILLAVGGLLHREIAIDDLLKRLVENIRGAMSADRGTIYVLDAERGQVISKVAHLPELEEIRLDIGQGVAGWVAKTGEIVNVPTTRSDARFYGGVDAQTGYKTESILAAPMRDTSGAIIGVVQLLNKRGGPFPISDEPELQRLADQAALAVEATTLYTPIPLSGQFNRIVGSSESLRRACQLTKKAAASNATVLVRGESGTGKELFARAIHVNSPRADGPFVKVDCAALPASLIENELFGHERGAFTGADAKAPGKFDAASGGTIFLDEIGELPLEVQGKLLRVLQDRAFDRVGGTETIETDVRVVAATNRDLEAMVAEGRFRGDLYYRIKVVQIPLPPLRERDAADIRRLADHFVVAAAKRHGRPLPTISDSAYAKLASYAWPGNVRELENCLESAVVIMDGTRVMPDDLPLPDRVRPTFVDSADEEGFRTLEDVERDHILRVLDRLEGNRTLAAKHLGIGRNTLARKLKSYGVS